MGKRRGESEREGGSSVTGSTPSTTNRRERERERDEGRRINRKFPIFPILIFSEASSSTVEPPLLSF